MKILINKNHKRIEATKLNGIKRKIIGGLAVAGATLVMFSGCSNSNAIEQPDNTTQNTTSISNNEKNEEPVTSFREEIKVDTTTFTENKAFTENRTITTTEQIEKETKVNTNSYNKLLNELKSELAKKDFDSNVDETLIKVFNDLYENYNSWQGLYKDLPTREEFIEDKLINSIAYINEFKIYKDGSPEAQQVIKEYGSTNLTTADNRILMTRDDEYSPMIALHEIAHAEQNIEESPAKEKGNYYYNGVDFSKALCEGEATFNMKFTTTPSSEKTTADIIDNSEGNIVEYGKSIREGYGKYLYIYENLNLFAGYKNLDSVKEKNIPSQIENDIAQKYGNELASEVMENLAKLIKLENSYNKDKQYQQAIETQKVFLKCIEKDIEALSSKNDVKKYINIYRGYKLNNLAQITDSEGNNITNEIFNIDELDNKMISKILEYNAIPEFTQNEKLNYMALKAILMASNEAYYDKEGIYQELYIPNTIDNTNYKYVEKDGVGNIIFKLENGRQLQVSFNEEEITNIQEASLDRGEYDSER